jgi:hypothetical protein
LGKTISEIEEISIDEFNMWLAYFQITDEKQKNAHKKV